MSKQLQAIIGIAVVIITFSVFYYLVISSSLETPTFNKEQLDWNENFEKNIELEKVYEDSQGLPHNHTLCIPVKKFYCNAVECENVEPRIFILLGGNSSEPTISRCDSTGCDTYDSIVDNTGNYKNIQPTKPKGFVFKMSFNTFDKKFVEVTTLGLDTFVSYGYCMYDYEYKK